MAGDSRSRGWKEWELSLRPKPDNVKTAPATTIAKENNDDAKVDSQGKLSRGK